jgi:hypothetical protein
MFMVSDNTYRPKTKKEKDKLRARKAAEQAAKKEREKRNFNKVSNIPSYTYEQRNTSLKITSATAPAVVSTKVEYEGEMAERERIAQEEVNRRKKCVAPAYNKGAYTYVSTEEQAKWIGR